MEICFTFFYLIITNPNDISADNVIKIKFYKHFLYNITRTKGIFLDLTPLINFILYKEQHF